MGNSRPFIDKSSPEFASINEPLTAGRSASRLLFDFGMMVSCLKQNPPNNKLLDFAAGTCWMSEWFNRMGYDVTALDISEGSRSLASLRLQADARVDPNTFSFALADGHSLPFESDSFGHICSFDSLHHMRSYDRVFSEFHRVLKGGGRAIFVEPGAKHATSGETLEFVAKVQEG